MEQSKQFLQDKGVLPFVSFKKQTQHTFKILAESKDSIKDDEGKIIEGMAYTVEENGEKKRWFTGSISAIQQISNYNAGDIVTVTMKRKLVDGQYRSYFEVTSLDKKQDEEPPVESY